MQVHLPFGSKTEHFALFRAKIHDVHTAKLTYQKANANIGVPRF